MTDAANRPDDSTDGVVGPVIAPVVDQVAPGRRPLQAATLGTGTVADPHQPEVQRLVGGRRPEYCPTAAGRGFDVEHFVRALWHDVYNRRDLSAVDRAYAATARWKGPSNRLGYGRQDVKGMARALLATFPDLGMAVDEVYWMGNVAEGYRVSVRWTAQGTHRGYALYGAPTHRRVRLWGIDQLYIGNEVITEDWMMFNEFDVMAQVLSDEPAPMVG